VGRTEEKGDDAGDDLSDYDCDYWEWERMFIV
jgi:hypothetical protein